MLYSCADCADCELCLVGHDVGGLDVAVVHGVLERGSSVGVLVAHVAVERDFGSSSELFKDKKTEHFRKGFHFFIRLR